jgi:hypothetical protein
MPSSATDNKEYAVERVIDYRKNDKGIDEYLIKWVGYPSNRDTWEPASNLNKLALKEALELKEEREAELRDKELFRQPDGSHLGECPLCFFPLSLDEDKSSLSSCCCKLVCDGCIYAGYKSGGGDRCPFCREPVHGEETHEKRAMKRVKANDPAALHQMGTGHCKKFDYDKALEYWTKAAGLGYAAAHFDLGDLYCFGEGVEEDEERGIYHYEKAAIGGHPIARHMLARIEEDNGNIDRAVKHYIIAANLGYEESMEELREFYSDGNITKEDFDATLRKHQSAIDEMKSPEREEAYAYFYTDS